MCMESRERGKKKIGLKVRKKEVGKKGEKDWEEKEKCAWELGREAGKEEGGESAK